MGDTSGIFHIIGASAAKPHMDDTSGIFHILYIDVRRTALIMRCGAQRIHLTAHAHRCVKLKQGRPLHARPGQGKLTRLLGCYWLSGKLIGTW